MDDALVQEDGRIRRFSPGRIVEHWMTVATFGVLVSTGLSQRFYSLDVSQWLILHLGGIDSVRLIHRFTGVILAVEVAIHLATAAVGVISGKWRPSMIITRQDIADLILNIGYYLGRESAPARGGRYTYKQKFEYWGILTGLLLMTLTGVILWFPVPLTRFLPGEIIPAAKVLHANEAMVVCLIISIWHIYSAVFSPEVFPLDTSIFTGYAPMERMRREHPAELSEEEDEATERERSQGRAFFIGRSEKSQPEQ